MGSSASKGEKQVRIINEWKHHAKVAVTQQKLLYNEVTYFTKMYKLTVCMKGHGL